MPSTIHHYPKFLICLQVEQEDRAVRVPAFTWDEINSGSIAGISSIKQAEEGVGHQIDVCLSADITSKTFTHILRFLYAGL